MGFRDTTFGGQPFLESFKPAMASLPFAEQLPASSLHVLGGGFASEFQPYLSP